MGLLRFDRMKHIETQNKFSNYVFAHVADVRWICKLSLLGFFFSLELPVKASADSAHPERTDSFKHLDLATTCENSGRTELKKRTALRISEHSRKLELKYQLQLSISETQTLIAQCIRHNMKLLSRNNPSETSSALEC